MKKRINRKKLIDELYGYRQGFRSAGDFVPTNEKDAEIFRLSMNAYHFGLDQLIADLGGESINEKD